MHIEAINKIVHHLESNQCLDLKYPFLEETPLGLQVCLDASLAKNYDQTSQLRYTVFLADINKKGHSLHWISYWSKQVAHSVLGSDVMAFAGSFNMEHSLKNTWRRFYKF